MKKLFTLFFLAATLFSFKGIAQTVPCTSLSVNFTSQAEANNSNVIHFTSTTIGYTVGDTIQWTFGDGTTSADLNPIHTYATAGVKQVCLIIRKVVNPGAPPCVNYHCTSLTVELPCNLSAAFTSQPSTSNPLGIYFTNTSTGFATGDSIRWSFGDGTYAYTTTAYHVYANAGTYNVCIWVKKNTTSPTAQPCISEICHSVTVTAPCNLVVNFTSQAATGAAPNVIQFTSTSTGYAAGDSIHWTFGDGSTSSELNPIHTYTTGNTYQVCLTIIKHTATGTVPCSGTICHNIAVTIPTCNLHAAFTSQTGTSGTTAQIVYFTNTSTGFATGDSIRWSFGDGTYSYDVNPIHTYATAGTFNVCLWVKKNGLSTATPCVSEICHTVTVTAPCTLSASFTSQPSTSNPLGVYFTNTSTGFATNDSIRWSFGDGTYAYTTTAYHAYANAGTYNVCIWVKKNNSSATTPACVSEICHTVTVTAPCNLVVNYTSYADSLHPNIIHFTNTSTGYAVGDSVHWTFGDGISSSDPNPMHTYTTGGTYQVCLTIIKHTASGTTPCTGTICHSITVANPCTLAANYTQHADSLNHQLIHFTNTTAPIATNYIVNWYFGDGSTATTWNTDHQFAQPGTYNVCLRVQYGNCVSYHCDSIHITQTQVSCSELANFHYTTISTTGPIAGFAPDHVYTDVTYTWTFGDGTGSHDITTTHVFATAGYYTVCLTAYRNNSCAATSCLIVHLPAGSTPNCNNNTLGFVTTTSNLSLNSVTFTGSSNAPILDQVWTITRVPATVANGTVTIHAINPTYAFSDTGSYYICLHATFAGGCTKDYCRLIHVSFPLPGTNACSLQLYPNPATSMINVLLTLTQPVVINAVIYNSSNMQMIQKEQQGVVGINTVNIGIGSLPAGVYTMRVTYGTQVCYATFIKQ